MPSEPFTSAGSSGERKRGTTGAGAFPGACAAVTPTARIASVQLVVWVPLRAVGPVSRGRAAVRILPKPAARLAPAPAAFIRPGVLRSEFVTTPAMGPARASAPVPPGVRHVGFRGIPAEIIQPVIRAVIIAVTRDRPARTGTGERKENQLVDRAGPRNIRPGKTHRKIAATPVTTPILPENNFPAPAATGHATHLPEIGNLVIALITRDGQPALSIQQSHPRGVRDGKR
jgi:hypothetical protein